MDFDIVSFLEKQYGHMPASRADKVRNLYELAAQNKQGCIVELGTYYGLGTATLCLGLQKSGHSDTESVYTIDDFIDRKGWANEEYLSADREIFEQRMRILQLNPTLICMTAHKAVEDWDKPIGLLFWDTGSVGDMLSDIILWEKHILIGGRIYLHDTNSGLLGSHETIEYLKSIGYKIIKDVPGHKILEKGLLDG